MSAFDHAAFLRRLKNNGFKFDVFFDVGSNIGRWSYEVQKVFPSSRYECFEPLVGRYEELDSKVIYSELHNYCLHPIALSDKSGMAKIKVLGDRGVGSSILILDSDFRKESKFIDVEVDTMDGVVEGGAVAWPDFIKLDTQAAEKKVLSGATKCLKHSKFVLLETWMRRVYGPETPLFHEIADFLYKRDYVLYEMLSLDEGRDKDGTLRWFGAVFINKDASHFPRIML